MFVLAGIGIGRIELMNATPAGRLPIAGALCSGPEL